MIGDPTVRTITPDGNVAIEQRMLGSDEVVPSTAQLSTEDLDDLLRQINGPSLRNALLDPQECPITKSFDVVVELQLDSSTLQKNVAGCLSPPDAVVPFDSLMDLVRRY